MRKSMPQMLAASIVIRSESGAPIRAPLSNLITVEAANIWES